MGRGRPFKFTDINELWDLFDQYKEHIKNNPITKPEMIKSGEKAGEIVQVPAVIVPERREFCLFIGITQRTFDYWLSEEMSADNNELFLFATHVRDWIQSYQTKAGLAGLANPMLVARINGIVEQINVNNNIQIQSLPVNLAQNVIDLTDYEYKVLD